MANSQFKGVRIAGISNSVPSRRFDNIKDTKGFTEDEVKKVVGMAGIKERRLADENTCSSDLCITAAKALIKDLGWETESIDGLIMVTQTPDYFLPQTSSIIHKELQLSENCASFDINLGCSGYPYGLWLASMMIKSGGYSRILLCHGDTAGRYSVNGDRAVALLFGDAGSATAIEASHAKNKYESHYIFHTDGKGYNDMIIEGGGFRQRFPEDPASCYVKMKGAKVFNFTLKRIPPLVEETLKFANTKKESIDYFIFHQSNKFIMKHLMNKIGLLAEKVPIILEKYGNTGGASLPLTITQGKLKRPKGRPLKLMLLGYGVGLSWASALIYLDPDAVLKYVEY